MVRSTCLSGSNHSFFSYYPTININLTENTKPGKIFQCVHSCLYSKLSECLNLHCQNNPLLYSSNILVSIYPLSTTEKMLLSQQYIHKIKM